VLPQIASRHPLWEDRLEDVEDRSRIDKGFLLDRGRETLGVTPLDAEPDVILKMPGDSLLPFALAVTLSVLFAGLLVNLLWLAGLGVLGVLVVLGFWFAPHPEPLRQEARANG
jgi:cytochrome c oxidase subunit 1/cytochrome c oxidase subunit I+III